MRVLCVVVVLGLGSVGLTGCGVSIAERVAWYEARLIEARGLAEAIDAKLDPALEHLAELQGQLDVIASTRPDDSLANRLRTAVAQTTNAIEVAQSQRAQVSQVIASAEAAVEDLKRQDVGWGGQIMAAGRVGKQIAPMTGNAAPWVYLGSSMLAALGGLLVRRPGDISSKAAKQREDKAWDEADGQAFDRGLQIGRAEELFNEFAKQQNPGGGGP